MLKSLPFFSPRMFEADRGITLEIVREVGSSATQKFILGEAVSALEREICGDAGARHAIACGSGTGALTLAVDAIGVGRGDEVIVPAFCCQPVASTIVNRGARPVFVDIDPRTMVMDPAAAVAAVTADSVAIMPAHVFSVMADMLAICQLAVRKGLKVVEDAAVAQGATVAGRSAGCWGDVGVLSFFQVKVLGAIGEGGMVLTDDDETARKCRWLRNHGQSSRFRHELIGYNSRMDEILGRFLLHRRVRFAERLDRRARIAARYTAAFSALEEMGVVTPPKDGGEGRCYYVYALLTDQRDELRRHLETRGIGTHVYYPLPLPSQPAFARFAQGERFPNAEAAGRRNLALPIWPELTDDDVAYIIDSVWEFFR
jgi:dTDP-4-amino-4,6-dideoxygalactose transaminase